MQRPDDANTGAKQEWNVAVWKQTFKGIVWFAVFTKSTYREASFFFFFFLIIKNGSNDSSILWKRLLEVTDLQIIITQFLSALLGVLAPFSSLFWFSIPQLKCIRWLSQLSSTWFPAAVLIKKMRADLDFAKAMWIYIALTSLNTLLGFLHSVWYCISKPGLWYGQHDRFNSTFF